MTQTIHLFQQIWLHLSVRNDPTNGTKQIVISVLDECYMLFAIHYYHLTHNPIGCVCMRYALLLAYVNKFVLVELLTSLSHWQVIKLVIYTLIHLG